MTAPLPSRLRSRPQRQAEVFTHVFASDVPSRCQLDVAAKFPRAFQNLEPDRQRRARDELQRNVFRVGEDAAKRLAGGKQEAAVLHLLGNARAQAEDHLPQRLHKLEARGIEKADVFEEFRDAFGGHGVRDGKE